jgi:hypothetical protein
MSTASFYICWRIHLCVTEATSWRGSGEDVRASMNVYPQDLALTGYLVELHIIPSTWILLYVLYLDYRVAF